MAKLAYANTMEAGYDLLEDLIEAGIKPYWIITLTPQQAQREKVSGYKDFRPLAEKHGIKVYNPANRYSMRSVSGLNEPVNPKDLAFFERERFDLMLVHGWQRLIPKEILETLTIGALGNHGSAQPLPKGRGRSPVNWEIINGSTRFLHHLFFIEPGVDSGDIIDVAEFDINSYDNCRTIYHKLTVSLRDLLARNIPKILDSTVTKSPQVGEKSEFPKRTPEDGRINWHDPTERIYNLVRGVTRPYPGAFSELNGRRFTIWEAQPFDTKLAYHGNQPGDVVEKFSDGSFVVVTGTDSLLVTGYQMEGSGTDIFQQVNYFRPRTDREAFEFVEKRMTFVSK